jgi:tRNA threonylcarbamoyladenosine biosynthesis protein TsaE
MIQEWHLADAEATEKLGEELAKKLRPGDLLFLQGPLGAGKTTLVRGLVRGLGGDPGEVCSPTFILRESYQLPGHQGIFQLHHLDLYRLRGRGEKIFQELGLLELLDEEGAVVAVEWPEELPPRGLAPRVVHIQLQWEGQGRRALVRWEEGPASV